MAERKTARQDYILRVRYRNTLPAPSFEPKLLKLERDLNAFQAANYLSSLIHEQPPNMEIDAELGMPIDLSLVPSVFEGDERNMLAPQEQMDLDTKDRVITRSTTEAQTTKLQNDVSFLRRTQYISSEVATTSRSKAQESLHTAKLEGSIKNDLEPKHQVAAIERTFASANTSITNLQHPTKRELRAIQAWPILPDLEHYEQQYVNAKFPNNPAPKTQSMLAAQDEDQRLEVAVLVPRIIDENSTAPDNDYIAYFLPDQDSAGKIQAACGTTTADFEQTSQYKFVREYDAKKEDSAAEWAINMHQNGLASYVELNGRMNMRGRRRGGQVTSPHETVELRLQSC